MKKAKTLLTALTAAAMLATCAVSFAAWDQLSATSSGTVTFDKPITVATTDMGAMTPQQTALGDLPVATGTVTFTVEKPADKEVELNLAPVVKNGETDVTDKFDVAISQDGADNGLTGNTDAKVDASNVYKVTVTPKDSAEAKALADTPLTVDVTATLAAKTAP
ncbi:MAG: hypothetical protein ACOYJA_07785 [Christensenellales bacterium]